MMGPWLQWSFEIWDICTKIIILHSWNDENEIISAKGNAKIKFNNPIWKCH